MLEDLYSRKLTGRWGILFAIIFVASTLRSPLTSVGPVIEQIKSALTLNNSLAGSLTTIPLLIFAVVHLSCRALRNASQCHVRYFGR